MSNPLSSLFSVLKVFLPIFLFFMVVGAVAGFGHRLDTVQDYLIAEADVRLQGERYVFQFTCDANNSVYVYSVDENKGKYLADLSVLLALKETELELPAERLEEYRNLISALLGGAVGGVNLKSVLKKPAAGWSWKWVKKTIIGVVGSVSGYSAGYYLGARYDTGCESSLVASALNDEEVMFNVEYAQLVVGLFQLKNLQGAALSQTGNAIYEWDKDPAFMCSPPLLAAKEQVDVLVEEDFKDLRSEEFLLIDRVTAMHNKIASTAAYKTLTDAQVYKHAEQFDQFEDSDSVVGERIRESRQKWDQACEVVGQMVF